MRTTISLDDRVGDAARRQARRQGVSFSAFVGAALRKVLTERSSNVKQPPFELLTAGGGGALPGVDLDRPSELLVAEDEARYGAEFGGGPAGGRRARRTKR